MSRQAELSGLLLSTLQLAGGHRPAPAALPGSQRAQVAERAGQGDTTHSPGGLGRVSGSASLSLNKGEGAGNPKGRVDPRHRLQRAPAPHHSHGIRLPCLEKHDSHPQNPWRHGLFDTYRQPAPL